ncbi:MAG: DUF3159 domain-containing protein [Candidatus Nanopelagicales bacterium]
MTVNPRTQLEQAIGGWRGALESSVPTLAFLLTYQFSDHNLTRSLQAAAVLAVLAALLRLVRKGSLQFIISGVIGVAVSAWLVSRTGNAKDYFVPGLITNVLWGLAYLVSVLVRYPLIGVLVGSLEGQPLKWVRDLERRKVAATATLLFAALFALRLIIEVPLYYANAINALGAAKLILGWPPYVLVVWLAYRLMRPYFGSAAAEDLL